MGTPLRGELTQAASNIPKNLTHADINDSLESIQSVLGHVVRLSAPRPSGPKIVVSASSSPDPVDESAAPWSWTAAEAVSTEVALLPFVMHLAASRDDVQGLRFCLEVDTGVNEGAASPDLQMPESQPIAGVVGGMANCIDAASGRTPLHVAALNGGIGCVNALLEAGALVHLRDALGHTALYYVRFSLPS